jgi:DNA-directed RNA polymerase specialized sigma24 family protein
VTPNVSHSLVAGLSEARHALEPGRPTDQEFEECYRSLFTPLVSHVAWRFGFSREDARDIVQDAFTIALIKLDPSGNQEPG